MRIDNILLQPVKQGFAYTIRSRAQIFLVDKLNFFSAPFTGDDAKLIHKYSVM